MYTTTNVIKALHDYIVKYKTIKYFLGVWNSIVKILFSEWSVYLATTLISVFVHLHSLKHNCLTIIYETRMARGCITMDSALIDI